MLVRDVMYQRIFRVSSDTTVYELVSRMVHFNIGSFLVEQDESIIGIVTERDCVRKVLAKKRDARQFTVNQIMTRALITVEASADLFTAADLMAKYSIKRLIVTENNEIIGMISTARLGKHLREIAKEATSS